jgi:hypothetical protein
MRYLDLSDKAKQNALDDYCDCMNVERHPLVMKDVVKWFEQYNHNVFNEDGLLKHRRNR